MTKAKENLLSFFSKEPFLYMYLEVGGREAEAVHPFSPQSG